MGAQKGVKR